MLAIADVVNDGSIPGPVSVTVVPVFCPPPPEDPVLDPDDPESRAKLNFNSKYISIFIVYQKNYTVDCVNHMFVPVENLFAGHPYLLLFRCRSISHRLLNTFPHDGQRCVPLWMCL